MDNSVRCHGHLLAFVLWVRCSLSIFPSLLITNDPGYGTPRGPHGDDLGVGLEVQFDRGIQPTTQGPIRGPI
ncbi:hypothetical protein CCUS01_13266 [Colletotrichum cuscutae]|uniref:Secreted protein n=1 Tax=Colletotrichum cuscutae TaxID=1209917 RepID=A0AAJ0DP96_9PEZI|nr:hypothetical protein CCUS01_13266 [Colletotrichum cuscutae]